MSPLNTFDGVQVYNGEIADITNKESLDIEIQKQGDNKEIPVVISSIEEVKNNGKTSEKRADNKEVLGIVENNSANKKSIKFYTFLFVFSFMILLALVMYYGDFSDSQFARGRRFKSLLAIR